MRKPAVILVSPKGAANVGGVARLMANFGLSELRIVSPRLSLDDPEVKKRALGAYELVENAKIFSSLELALADLTFSAAYTMRLAGPRPSGDTLESLEEKFYFKSQAWGMVFGREDNGLDSSELRLCSFQIQIPTEEVFPSINLTSSVAISLWDWYSKTKGREKVKAHSGARPHHHEVEIFFLQLRDLLAGIGFIKHVESDHILRDLRDLYHRADPNDRDLRILFGTISDLKRVLLEKAPKISNS